MRRCGTTLSSRKSCAGSVCSGHTPLRQAFEETGDWQLPAGEQLRHGQHVVETSPEGRAVGQEDADFTIFGIEDPDSQATPGEQEIDFALERLYGLRGRDDFDCELRSTENVLV